jgi:ABC-type amino acid transport substrate-binding protein
MRGRPRLYGSHSKKFLQYYLDPLMTGADICRQCGISLATFYNYEKELQIPQLRVGVENDHTQFSHKKALKMFSRPGELFELKIVRELAARMNVRVKLIPYDSSDANSALNGVKKNEIDFAVADLSWTRERNRHFYFSDSYKPEIGPSGFLMRLKGSTPVQAGVKPVLGANEGSVHLEYANDHLQNDFQLKKYSNVEPLLLALHAGEVNFVILNPVWLEIFPQYAPNIEIVSKRFIYRSHTGVVFHADSEHWRPAVNEALAQLLEDERKSKK